MEFEMNPFLKTEKQHELARRLNVSEKRISKWYANRRADKRKEGLLTEGEYYL